jgi:plastocyanin
VTRAVTLAAIALLAGLAPAMPVSPAAASPVAASAQGVVHVTIRDHTFVPRVVHVKSGETIVFTNEDQDPHTVTSGAGNVDDGRWTSSPLIPDGASFALHLTKPGTYPYFCTPHQFQDSMHGTIVVTR